MTPPTKSLDETAGKQPDMFISTVQYFAWYQRRMTKRLKRADKAAMIEDYIANDMSIKDISKKHDVSYYKACNAVSAYFKKLPYTITIMSKV